MSAELKGIGYAVGTIRTLMQFSGGGYALPTFGRSSNISPEMVGVPLHLQRRLYLILYPNSKKSVHILMILNETL